MYDPFLAIGSWILTGCGNSGISADDSTAMAGLA